jgi:CheY-like chemotaxis protein
VVEDNHINQVLATRMLEKRGYSVVLANDGREAVDLFARQRFDAILMDVQMPQMDGFQATSEIRRIEKQLGARSTPIIALTAHAMKGDEEKCLAAGMDSYLSKPIKVAELHRVLESLAAKE